MPEAADPYLGLRDRLVAAGLLLPSAARGLYGRSGRFERVIQGFQRLVTAEGAPEGAEALYFPPIFARADYVKLSHIQNFPDLMGSVHAFTGGEAEYRELLRQFGAGEDWTRSLTPAAVMLLPAACYPLYPTATGTLPDGGRLVELTGQVFRHEPSDDPARMQAFRQHEYVRLGTADETVAHRDGWKDRGLALLTSLGLAAEVVVANDPFFGRGGKLAKASQREQTLKFEFVVPVANPAKPTAIGSCNYHVDYFGHAYAIQTADGGVAHTSCVGFGLERVALALFVAHGFDEATWPAEVRARLGLG